MKIFAFLSVALALLFVPNEANARKSAPCYMDNDARTNCASLFGAPSIFDEVRKIGKKKNAYARTKKTKTSVARAVKPAEPAIVTTALRPARYIAGRLVCAVNVNAALAERGIRGTGSRLAKSFLGWGRPSGPVPGAVAVYNRGRDARKGHVAIVSHVSGGKVYVWNPGRSGWRLVAYPKAAVAYRVPA